MYENVLVPTDGSAPAANAAEQAYEIADRFDATLHSLFVISVSENTPLGLPVEPAVEGLRNEGQRLTAEVTEGAPDGVETVTAIEQGDPDKRILEYAAEEDVDVIVMGTHGRRGLDRFLIGSVTERVIRQAECSVLVTQPDG